MFSSQEMAVTCSRLTAEKVLLISKEEVDRLELYFRYKDQNGLGD